MVLGVFFTGIQYMGFAILFVVFVIEVSLIVRNHRKQNKQSSEDEYQQV